MTPFRIPTITQWINPDGSPVREFQRFIANLFGSAGGGGVASSISVGASPFTFTASVAAAVIVQGGTVSKIEFSRDQSTFFDTGETAGWFPIKAQDQLRVTYSVTPNMTMVPS